MKKYTIEVCANSAESAINAQKAKADRIELCCGLTEGGLTPSYGEILKVRELMIQTKLYVLIRPRNGYFYYSETEQEIMLHDIEFCQRAGVDGVVLGCLTPNGDIDIITTKKLIASAGDMSLTFHRAFDVCRNPFKALDDIVSLGCHRILTSGMQSSAEKGIPLIKELIKYAQQRIIILPGCGINAQNIRKIAETTNAQEFHFSAKEKVSDLSGCTSAISTERERTSVKLVTQTVEALYEDKPVVHYSYYTGF